MKRLFVALIILLAVFQVKAQEKYLVPVKKDQTRSLNAYVSIRTFGNYETVCVQDNCYYAVDKETAQQLVRDGVSDGYEPPVERYLFYATPEQTSEIRSNQWALKNSFIGWDKAKVYMDALPTPANNSGASVIAVLDTGSDPHEDLVDILWDLGAEIYGYTFEDNFTGGIKVRDQSGHGNHVSGIAGASMLNGGMASTSYGKANLLNMKLTGGKSIELVNTLKAIDKVIELKKSGIPITVVNMSYGGIGYSNAENLAVKSLYDAGIIAVAAVGNDGKNMAIEPHYPASHNYPNVVAVAALDSNTNLASFSNYGGATSIAAPGSNIYSVESRFVGKYSRPGASYIAYDSDLDGFASVTLGDGWSVTGSVATFSAGDVSAPLPNLAPPLAEYYDSHALIADFDSSILTNYPYQMLNLDFETYAGNIFGFWLRHYQESCNKSPRQDNGTVTPLTSGITKLTDDSYLCLPLWLEEIDNNKIRYGFTATSQEPIRFRIQSFSGNTAFKATRLLVAGSRYPDSYVSLSGTSMAAPFVTGAIAAAKALHPDITIEQLIYLLYASSNKRLLPVNSVKDGNVINLYAFFDAVNECKDNLSKCTDYAPPPEPPNADFSYQADSYNSLRITFWDISTAGSSPINSYEWKFGEMNAASAQKNPSYTYGSAGTYSVNLTVTDANGKSANATKSITVSAPAVNPPSANFMYQTDSANPLKVAFTNLSATGALSIASYLWDFGNGAASAELNPTYTYSASGTYIVTLTVADTNGNKAYVTKSVVISATDNNNPQDNISTDNSTLSEENNNQKTTSKKSGGISCSMNGDGTNLSEFVLAAVFLLYRFRKQLKKKKGLSVYLKK